MISKNHSDFISLFSSNDTLSFELGSIGIVLTKETYRGPIKKRLDSFSFLQMHQMCIILNESGINLEVGLILLQTLGTIHTVVKLEN